METVNFYPLLCLNNKQTQKEQLLFLNIHETVIGILHIAPKLIEAFVCVRNSTE